VIATLTAAIMQIMPIVGCSCGTAEKWPNRLPNIEQREDESSRKPECRVQLTATILAAIISNI